MRKKSGSSTVTLHLEQLERRRLLAADLEVQVSAAPFLVPGEPIAYTVQVTNHGPDDADAQILLGASDFLDEPRWDRETTSQSQVDEADYEDFGPTIESPESWDGFSHVSQGIGDINGDGKDDLLFTENTRWPVPAQSQAWIVFGGELPFEGPLVTALDGTNGFKLTGTEKDISSVSGGGDLNGDGIGDLVIGSENANPQGEYQSNGLTYVVFGSSTGIKATLDVSELDGVNGFVIRGVPDQSEFGNQDIGSRMGTSVGFLNDFNGDGVDDLAIGGRGVPWETNSSLYIVFGSTTPFPADFPLSDLNGANGFRISHSRAFLGQSVTDAGDINDDGINDLALGWFNSSVSITANATILFGSTEQQPSQIDLNKIDQSRQLVIQGNPFFVSAGFPADQDFGASVDGLGDFNGDGIDDVIIGTPTTDTEERVAVGATYVVFGSNEPLPASIRGDELDGTNGFKITTGQEFQGMGRTVAGVGDVNGDDFADMLVTAGDGYRPTNKGWLIYGSNSTFESVIDPRQIDHRITDLGEFEFATTAGDVDNDGKPDMLIGANQHAHLILGRATPELNPTEGQANLDENVSVAALTTTTYQVTGTVKPDVEGVYAIEAAVESSVEDPEPDNNRASVDSRVFRHVDLMTTSDGTPDASPGQSVSLDFMVANHGISNSVATSIHSEFSNLLVNPTWTRTLTLPQPPIAHLSNNELDSSDGIRLDNNDATTAGDFNGDGLADLVTVIDRQVVAILGSNNVPNEEDRITFSAASGLREASLAGDINGDGLSDLLAQGQNGSDNFMVFGQREIADAVVDLDSLDGTNGFRVVTSQIGQRVDPVGDTNGDGYDDFAVITNATGLSAMVLPGRAAFDARLDIDSVESSDAIRILTGNKSQSPGSRAANWRKLADAGDVNGDGISDILIGLANDFSGTAFVVYGRRTAEEATDLSNLTADEGFAILPRGGGTLSVGPAGDVNGDGLADVMAGFDGDQPSDLYWVNVTIVLGSKDLTRHEETTVSTTAWQLDMTVDTVGDINVDGIDDIFASPDSHIFGARDFQDLDASLRSLQDPDGYVGAPIRNIGDFNGDHIADYVVNDFLLFGPTTSERMTGSGPINELLDLPHGSHVTYEVSGTVRSDAKSEPMENTLIATAGPLRTDTNTDNNTATQFTNITAPLAGDIDGDGEVAFADFLILTANFGKEDATRSEGDIDDDGKITFSDFLLLSRNYGRHRR